MLQSTTASWYSKRNRLKQKPRVFHVANLLFHLLKLYLLFFAIRLCIPAQFNWRMDIGRIFKSEKWEKNKWFYRFKTYFSDGFMISIHSLVALNFRKSFGINGRQSQTTVHHQWNVKWYYRFMFTFQWLFRHGSVN